MATAIVEDGIPRLLRTRIDEFKILVHMCTSFRDPSKIGAICQNLCFRGVIPGGV